MAGWRTEELTQAALTELPRTRLSDVREGRLLKVVGRVDLLEPLLSPLAHRSCAAYSVKLQEKVTTFDSLVRVIESAARDFVLRDDSGFVVVRAANASIFWERGREPRTAADHVRATPETRAFLKKHDLPATDWVGELPYSFSEGVLGAGDEIALVGRARREADPYAPSAFRDLPTRLIFEAATDPLIIACGPERWRIR
ncbi:MAG: hypothetical protein JWN44_2793 [Myxococcales bacterium]|nr:hypothetical protein [Myxococcales bacterium]